MPGKLYAILVSNRWTDIFVPPDQVIDTVDLYFIKARQRRLSLKFLTWFVLGENIQTDTHDSIEDARSALQLYKAYHEFEENGTFDEKLEELYREGKANVRLSFKGDPRSLADDITIPDYRTGSHLLLCRLHQSRHLPRGL